MKAIRFDIPISKKGRAISGLAAAGACCAICLFLCLYSYLRYSRYPSYDLSGMTVHDGEGYSWALEGFFEDSEVVRVDGWIYRNDEVIQRYRLSLIIANPDGSVYQAPTMMVGRTDIAVGEHGETMRWGCGFTSAINKRYVEQGARIYVLYQNDGHNDLIDLGMQR